MTKEEFLKKVNNYGIDLDSLLDMNLSGCITPEFIKIIKIG